MAEGLALEVQQVEAELARFDAARSVFENVEKVAAGDSFELEVSAELGARIEYSFFLADGADIGFAVDYYEAAEEDEAEDAAPREILASERSSPDEAEPTSGAVSCDATGTFVLVFDNSYSWMNAKEVSFRVVSSPPASSEQKALRERAAALRACARQLEAAQAAAERRAKEAARAKVAEAAAGALAAEEQARAETARAAAAAASLDLLRAQKGASDEAATLTGDAEARIRAFERQEREALAQALGALRNQHAGANPELEAAEAAAKATAGEAAEAAQRAAAGLAEAAEAAASSSAAHEAAANLLAAATAQLSGAPAPVAAVSAPAPAPAPPVTAPVPAPVAPAPAPASPPALPPLTLDTPLATFDVILRRKAAGQGLGLQLEVMEPSGFIVVDGVLPGGIAAEHGGIAVGDVLISVGADKVVNKSFDTVRTLLQKAAPLMELPLVFGRRA